MTKKGKICKRNSTARVPAFQAGCCEFESRRLLAMKYGYTACDGGLGVNAEYRHYFRLYRNDGKRWLLVAQGLAPEVDKWKTKYGNPSFIENPYPKLD